MIEYGHRFEISIWFIGIWALSTSSLYEFYSGEERSEKDDLTTQSKGAIPSVQPSQAPINYTTVVQEVHEH